jgi:hypothetical protein
MLALRQAAFIRYAPFARCVDRTRLADVGTRDRGEMPTHKKKPGAWEPGKPPSERGGGGDELKNELNSVIKLRLCLSNLLRADACAVHLRHGRIVTRCCASTARCLIRQQLRIAFRMNQVEFPAISCRDKFGLHIGPRSRCGIGRLSKGRRGRSQHCKKQTADKRAFHGEPLIFRDSACCAIDMNQSIHKAIDNQCRLRKHIIVRSARM